MTQEAAMFNEWASQMDQVYAPFDTYEDFNAAEKALMYTFDEDTISDLHKDAYGFRPGEYFWETWNDASDDQKQVIWDDLVDELQRGDANEILAEAIALAKFEAQIAKTMELGARDRETAIRWIVEGLDLGQYADAEYACWALNLNYNCAKLFDGVLPRGFV
jgi:beta-lactamase class D